MAKLSEEVARLTELSQEMVDAVQTEKIEVSEKLTELSGTIAALQTKVEELGEVDPSLAALISEAEANLAEVQGIVSTPVEDMPEDAPTPTEPMPEPTPAVEEPVAPTPEAPVVEEPTAPTPAEPVVEEPAAPTPEEEEPTVDDGGTFR